MGVEKIDKRVRETSLRKFITISGQLFVIILSLCTDTGSACYVSEEEGGALLRQCHPVGWYWSFGCLGNRLKTHTGISALRYVLLL